MATSVDDRLVDELAVEVAVPADCTMKTAASCSFGSTQKNVPA